MKKVTTLIFVALIAWATTMPAKIDKAKMDDGVSNYNGPYIPADSRFYTAVDSSVNGYTMWTQMQECLAYNPPTGNLQFVCRHFATGNNLDVCQTDSAFALLVYDPMVYPGTFGGARYPSSVGSDDGSYSFGPHISAPYLFPGPAWGGMVGQFESGSWFSQYWDPAVDVGPGNLNTHKNIGKQLPNGDILFIGVTADDQIRYSTWSYDLSTMRANGVVAPATAYYWGFDINGGIAYVFYYDDNLNVYYKTTTDGINWSAQQSYNMVWPNPYPQNLIFWTQAVLTDAGEPKLIFDNLDYDNYQTGTYPYLGKIYVSPGSGQPCSEVSTGLARNFYPTIAAGGNYLVALWHSPVTNDIDSLTFWNLFYNWSTDGGVTWDTPHNLTAGFTYRHGLAQLSKRLATGPDRFFFVFGQDMDVDHDPIWHVWRDASGTDHMRWYWGWEQLGIEEQKIETPKRLSLDITPNPVNNRSTISYTLPVSGEVSVKVYSADGRLIRTIEQGYKSAGVYTNNLNAGELPNGAYLVVLKTTNQKITGKLVVAH
ncbi:MAG: T9SS type A sorting domain-containing protein [candidate division WOR-3 bacterium]